KRSIEQVRSWIDEVALQIGRPRVTRHANHLNPGVGVRVPFEPEAAPDGARRIVRAEILPRHRLADHADAWRAAAIALVDGAAEQDRNTQHVEIAGPRPDRAGDRCGPVRTGC